MSLGLKDVLGVNTGNISGKKGEQKTLGTAEEDGSLKAQNFIQTTVNAMIKGTKKSDGTSADSLEWTEAVNYAANTYVLYEGGIYKSEKINKAKKPNENTEDWSLIKDHAAFDKEVSATLSFDADMVRKEIIAWGLGRVAADYQLDIDNDESYWDQWTSGLDLGISAINTLSNIFSGSSTRRSLVKMGDSYVMMAQDAAEGSDNTNFLYKFSANKKSAEEKSLGYYLYHKPIYNSPILLCIQSLCQAADKAMEEIADDKLDPEVNSPERSVLYAKKISGIKQTGREDRHEKEKSIVQNEIVDRVALYIANYYMISSFMAPKAHPYIKEEDDNWLRRNLDFSIIPDDVDLITGQKRPDPYIRYKADKLIEAASEKVLFEIHENNKYDDPSKDKNDNKNLKPNQPYRLLLPVEEISSPALSSSQPSQNSDNNYKLFLEVVKVTPNVITNGGVVTENGAEVEVKIKLPEAIEASLSSSIVHSGFNFKFTIPEKIYKDGLNDDLVTSGKLNSNGKAAQQVFIDIAQNFVKAINPILEANPITGYAEMFMNTAPDLMDSSKLFVELVRSIRFHKNNTKKGEFERAADCYGAIPTVLEHSLAYIKSGHYFDAATNVRSIGSKLITLNATSTLANSVTLTWNAFPGATGYYVFKDGKATPVVNVATKPISGLTASTSYSFYVNAVNASGTVLAQSQTLMVTTAAAPAEEPAAG